MKALLTYRNKPRSEELDPQPTMIAVEIPNWKAASSPTVLNELLSNANTNLALIRELEVVAGAGRYRLTLADWQPELILHMSLDAQVIGDYGAWTPHKVEIEQSLTPRKMIISALAQTGLRNEVHRAHLWYWGRKVASLEDLEKEEPA